jgi:hypothetical protein
VGRQKFHLALAADCGWMKAHLEIGVRTIVNFRIADQRGAIAWLHEMPSASFYRNLRTPQKGTDRNQQQRAATSTPPTFSRGLVQLQHNRRVLNESAQEYLATGGVALS